MGRRKEYMPRQNTKFFHFQRILVTRVEAKKVAWGIPDSAVQVLANHRAVYEPLFHKARYKRSRTMTDVLARRAARRAYEKDIRVFVNAHIRSNGRMSATDRLSVGLPPPDRKPSPKPNINEIPSVGLEPIGGGWIKVTCRRTTDQDRPSMHKHADVIECRYALLPKGQKPPRGLEELPNFQISSRARFIIKCGYENAGHTFWGRFRWANISNPANSGSWSSEKRVVIA